MARRKSKTPKDGDMLPIRNSMTEFLTFVCENAETATVAKYATVRPESARQVERDVV